MVFINFSAKSQYSHTLFIELDCNASGEECGPINGEGVIGPNGICYWKTTPSYQLGVVGFSYFQCVSEGGIPAVFENVSIYNWYDSYKG